MPITALPSLDRTSATFRTDVDTFFGTKIPTFSVEAEAARVEMNSNVSTATTAASTATAQVVLATTQAALANNSAIIAVNAPGTSATSTSSLLVGSGSKTLTVQTGKSIVSGMTVKIAYSVSPSTWMLGDVLSYNSGTGALTVQVQSFTNSGTFSDWVVSLSAPGGATLAGTETFTNKTIIETVFALTGSTPVLLATNGAVQTWALSANSTPTESLTSGQSIILVITPGAFTITWPTTVWTKQGGSGAAPTLFSAGKTTVVLWKVNSTLYGSHLGDTV